MIRVAFSLMLAVLLMSCNVQAQEMTVNVSVSVDATKANGSPWDGVPRLGNSKINLNAAPDIEQSFGTVLSLFLVFGIAFEVPVAVVVLARLGVVTIEHLKAWRGYFIVGAAVVSAIVTPPDVISQLSLLFPMIILYEIGIVAARVFIKHTKAPEESAEKAT